MLTLLGGELLLLGRELALQVGKLTMAELSRSIEVVGALGLLRFAMCPLDLGPDLLDPSQRLTLPTGPS
jgi:hypothetical protein